MIISKQKSFHDILSSIDNRSVFLMGCSECATLCHTGGKEEVLQLKKQLEKQDIMVTGWMVLDPACHLLNDKRMMKQYPDEIDEAEIILVLACGNGVQTVAELFEKKPVISGTDSLFLGEIKHVNEFERRCNLCGTCIIDQFYGLCPLSRCPKKMLNGPCGGSQNGYCEVNEQNRCVWDEILEKQLRRGRKKDFLMITPPHDWSQSIVMNKEDE